MKRILSKKIKSISTALFLPLSGMLFISCDDVDSTAGGTGSHSQQPVVKDLGWAASNGDLEMVKSLLTTDNIGRVSGHEPALFLAAGNGHAHVVKYLLEQGADPNLRCLEKQHSPIMAAALGGHPDVIDLLIEGGGEVNDFLATGRHAIHVAAAGGRLDVIKTLVKHGVSHTLETRADQSNQQRRQIERELGRKLSSPQQPIHIAAERNHPHVVQYLLELGVTDEVRKSALGWAANNGWSEHRSEVIRLLDKDGDYEKVSSETINTNGYYTADVYIPGTNTKTKVYIRFHPLEYVALFKDSDKQPVLRVIVSFGAMGGESPEEVKQWLDRNNEITSTQPNVDRSFYKVHRDKVNFSTARRKYDFFYEDGHLHVLIRDLSASHQDNFRRDALNPSRFTRCQFHSF